jgi:hypothetical protein
MEYELTARKWIRWKDWSLHANARACTPYAMRITGTHSKYGLDGDWLDKQKIDGDVCFDVSRLQKGDLVKVSGASHGNDRTSYWQIESVSQTLRASQIKESEVYEIIEGSDDDDLRRDLIDKIWGADSEQLEQIRDILS